MRCLYIFMSLFFVMSCSQEIEIMGVAKNNSNLLMLSRQVSETQLINKTFLGNEKRNYYGNEAPSSLNIHWQYMLGKGKTCTGGETIEWAGAGWTGQPLMIKFKDTLYLIQGAYDHNLKKIRASDGKLMAQFEFDDVIKGTASIWRRNNLNNQSDEFYILQGSRKGCKNSLNAYVIPSYKAISFTFFDKVWEYNSSRLRSYSRDVDGSALIINDTAYLGLENGLFIVFDPNPDNAKLKDGILQPHIFDIDTIFYRSDVKTHGGNLVTESSPSRLNGRIYISSGSGHLFGYNIATKQIDWVFDTGADMDGSPAVTNDSCLIITIEKEYISGKGGVMKINPARQPEDCVEWFFPTDNHVFAHWDGGVIGSASINDYYNNDTIDYLTAFVAIDENLYVVKHKKIDSTKMVKGPMLKKTYYMPELVFKYKTGASISSPVIVRNKIIAATYEGVYLFEFDKNLNFKLLHHQDLGSFEATPFIHNKKIYLAGRNGFLYCFGD